MQQYRENVANLRDKLMKCSRTEKNCLVVHAMGFHEVNQKVLDGYMQKVFDREGETDFQIIALIRLLFLGHHVHELEAAKIISGLSKFPFWPINGQLHKDVDKIVFWSENHILMMLSSCYLFKQFQYTELKLRHHDSKASTVGSGNSSDSTNRDVPPYEHDLETNLLVAYLQAHCSNCFNGVYEVNSHVYLPYTLSALFNIYDFSLNDNMKQYAEIMIHNIIRHILQCTPYLTGIANLSASARGFPRTRTRNWGHNINQLINLFNDNISGDSPSCTAITDFLVTTTWEPREELFSVLMSDQDIRQQKMSHEVSTIRDIYCCIDESEVTPLFWSAGLVLHPDFTIETKRYQKLKQMEHNKHLWPLSYVPSGYLKSITDSFELFSKGQVYCDIHLNVYKKSSSGLCLTSFEQFNPHYSGFQQLPWIANIHGVGVWTQSGSDSSLVGFALCNTHNPACVQRGSILLAAYVAPAVLADKMNLVSHVFDYKVKLFWPSESLMDDYRIVNVKFYEGQGDNGTIFAFNDATAVNSQQHDVSENHFAPPSDVIDPPVKASGPSKPKRASSIGKLNPFKTVAKIVGEVLNNKSQAPLSNHGTDSAMYNEKNTWGVFKRQQCYIGVLCTKKTIWDTDHHKHSTYQTSRDKALDVPIYGRICESRRHTWITVVGTTQEYPTIDDFITQRLFKIQISEWGEGSGNSDPYRVEVNDPIEGRLSYNYSASNR